MIVTPAYGIVLALATLLLFEVLSRAFFTRFVLKQLFRFFAVAEIQFLKLFRLFLPPRYLVLGSCQQRGTCCTMILGNPPQFVKNRPFLMGLFAGYHKAFHNFSVAGRGTDDELIFSCGYLQDDGRCGIYRTRPFLCRNYPIRPFFQPPAILPGCAYRVVPRSLAAVVRSPRPALRILNPHTRVHHPTRLGGRGREEKSDDFVGVEDKRE